MGGAAKNKKLNKTDTIANLQGQLNNVVSCIHVFKAITGSPFHTSSLHNEAERLAAQIQELKQDDRD